ncbi:MAG: cytochrome P450 [Candidatus Eremiobacteraeota bacterium]|nr:cytochrome P450 [Candidatus Eremiobacteraeota bacterium]
MTLQISADQTESKLVPIPQPPAHFMMGNLPELKLEGTPVESMMKLAEEYGPIFRLDLGSGHIIVASSFELAEELCDTKRFDKGFGPGLKQIRVFSGDGLFSAYTHEPNWRKAHNILMPNFSHAAMKRYMPAMLEIARLLIEKWEKAADSGAQVDVPEDMTRLTLDTIGLCGFDHRFDSFRRDTPHPFVDAMMTFLSGMQENARRPAVVNKLLYFKQKKITQGRQYINDYVDQIVRERKTDPARASKVDLLSCMLDGVDRESGEQLEDLTIRLNIVTFLIAGHETTSGLLSFAIYFLLHHPDVLARAYEEVDRVLTEEPTFEQIHQLQYLLQILKETLRLYPTAPFFTLAAYEDTVLGGKYFIPKDQPVQLLLPSLHRDPAIWGPKAHEFNPDNFAPDLEEKRPVNAYKGFGNGQRACIGRQFALQEAVLVLALVLQRFRLVDIHQYKLHLKQSLTIKPGDFQIKLQRRPVDEAKKQSAAQPVAEATRPAAPARQRPTHGTPLLVLYGSNTGSSEAFARQVAEDGDARGFQTEVAELDAFVGKLPRQGAVLVFSSSYNGAPPDNAVKFCQWLESAETLQGVKFGVFGCGNRDWAASYQQVPKQIDQRLEALGAERVIGRGEGDARGDFDGHFSNWYAPLWAELAARLGIEESLEAEAKGDLYEVEFLEQKRENPFVAAFGARPMTVVENREIFQSPERSARHIEVVLPEGMNYRIGDHLGVVARNSAGLVKRAANRFALDPEARIRIKKKGTTKTLLPIDQVVPLGEILSEYVELQDVATRKHIKIMAENTPCPPEQRNLQALVSEDERYAREVLAKGKSVLDLLEDHPSCQLPFNLFLEMLAGLRPRYYSISSSPLSSERICSITVGVLNDPARSGKGRYQGTCSNYLAGLKKGQQVYAFVRENHPNFHLPEDSAKPVLMVGPGTGLAPFRGFLQERSALQAQGETLGKALLFYGCRHSKQDYAYETELQEFVEHGVCQLVTAFSRENEQKVYVQHRVLENKELVWQLFEDGGTVYICGDGGKMAPDVRRAFAQIHQEKTGQDAQAAEDWLKGLETSGRYMVDVWSST